MNGRSEVIIFPCHVSISHWSLEKLRADLHRWRFRSQPVTVTYMAPAVTHCTPEIVTWQHIVPLVWLHVVSFTHWTIRRTLKRSVAPNDTRLKSSFRTFIFLVKIIRGLILIFHSLASQSVIVFGLGLGRSYLCCTCKHHRAYPEQLLPNRWLDGVLHKYLHKLCFTHHGSTPTYWLISSTAGLMLSYDIWSNCSPVHTRVSTCACTAAVTKTERTGKWADRCC